MIETELLKSNEFFSDFSGSDLESLAKICMTKNLQKKEILFWEGATGYAAYVCLRGNIQLYKTGADGKEIVIKLIKPGEMFAEVILFEQQKYPVSARVLSESTVLIIPRNGFRDLLNQTEFRDDFIRVLMQKQRYLTNRIKYLSSADVEERLFLFLKEQFGEQKQIKTRLSKKDVAAAIGTTPETLSRVLIRLKNEQKMEWQSNQINLK